MMHGFAHVDVRAFIAADIAGFAAVVMPLARGPLDDLSGFSYPEPLADGFFGFHFAHKKIG